jgi:hypothetical protein
MLETDQGPRGLAASPACDWRSQTDESTLCGDDSRRPTGSLLRIPAKHRSLLSKLRDTLCVSRCPYSD